jgi:hypothetical protein
MGDQPKSARGIPIGYRIEEISLGLATPHPDDCRHGVLTNFLAMAFDVARKLVQLT